MSIAGSAGWLAEKRLQRLLEALSADGEKARIVGGAVRNALIGVPVTDIDIATTTTPDETERRARAAGMKTVPTGKDHGTITVIVSGRPFEVTTLRDDVATDGRRATVRFGRDWRRDAERRDFTINALYADADGTVADLVGGVDDIERRNLRFIGDAETRIREDYLRILRFFRFFAWYGKGRPDAQGLKACARLKSGLDTLSAERVWSEMKKLLGAPEPSRALLWMRQTGVLTAILPESEKWGIDGIHGLIDSEAHFGWQSDAMLRLMAILPPDAARMTALARRLRMSKAEAKRLEGWAFAENPKPGSSEADIRRLLYRGDPVAIVDRLRLALASARMRAGDNLAAVEEAGDLRRLLAVAENWKKPAFPLTGDDLKQRGVEAGPQLGKILSRLENEWIEADFTPGRDALLERAAEFAK